MALSTGLMAILKDCGRACKYHEKSSKGKFPFVPFLRDRGWTLRYSNRNKRYYCLDPQNRDMTVRMWLSIHEYDRAAAMLEPVNPAAAKVIKSVGELYKLELRKLELQEELAHSIAHKFFDVIVDRSEFLQHGVVSSSELKKGDWTAEGNL